MHALSDRYGYSTVKISSVADTYICLIVVASFCLHPLKVRDVNASVVGQIAR